MATPPLSTPCHPICKSIVLVVLALPIFLPGCNQEEHSYQGHFIYFHEEPGKYETADVYDSIIIVNKDVLGKDPDTIWFDRQDRRFVRSTANERTFRNVEFTHQDTLTLYAQYDDPGIWSQFFVKGKPEYERDLFALCNLDIQLPSYDSGMIASQSIMHGGVQRIYIGQPKDKSINKNPDGSPFIQVNDVYIQPKVIDHLLNESIPIVAALALHFDKHEPDTETEKIRAAFVAKSKVLKILEATLKDGQLVYIQLN